MLYAEPGHSTTSFTQEACRAVFPEVVRAAREAAAAMLARRRACGGSEAGVRDRTALRQAMPAWGRSAPHVLAVVRARGRVRRPMTVSRAGGAAGTCGQDPCAGRKGRAGDRGAAGRSGGREVLCELGPSWRANHEPMMGCPPGPVALVYPSDLGFCCAPGRIRTCDRRIRSPVLYPLSYGCPIQLCRGATGDDARAACRVAGVRGGAWPVVLRSGAGPVSRPAVDLGATSYGIRAMSPMVGQKYNNYGHS